jgi:hypothetical protein
VGKHYPHGSSKAMEPGTIVEAPSLEFFGAAAKKFELVSEDPKPPEPARLKLQMIERARGHYDVVNQATGRTLNSKPQTEKEARALIDACAGDEIIVEVDETVLHFPKEAEKEAEKDESPGSSAGSVTTTERAAATGTTAGARAGAGSKGGTGGKT